MRFSLFGLAIFFSTFSYHGAFGLGDVDNCSSFLRVRKSKVGSAAFVKDWERAFYGADGGELDPRHFLAAVNAADITKPERQKIFQGVVNTVAGMNVAEVPEYPEASQYARERLADPETHARVKDFLKRWETDLAEAGAPVESRWQWIKDVAYEALMLPRTLWRIHRITADAYSPAAMDTNLYAYFGFHQEGEKDKTFRMRPWVSASIKDIKPSDIEGMSFEEVIRVLRISMEIEAPIVQYTVQSGEGFAALLPGLARFMGKSEAQAKYALEKNLAWCVSPWCAEEDRHAPAFARMIERLTNGRWTPPTENPSGVDPGSAEMKFAEKHVDSRMSTEWSASSVYVMLLAHTKEGSPLQRFLENVVRDEVKHLAIISAAHVHLYGERPWMRMWRMVKAVASLAAYHGETRSTASDSYKNPIGVFETLYTLAVTEYHTRKWLRSLPPETLISLFETDSKLADLPEFEPKNDDERKAIAERAAFRAKIVEEGKKWRDARAGWLPEKAADVGRQIEFNRRSQAQLDMATRFYGRFEGAEDPTGIQSHSLVKRFAALIEWPGVLPSEMAMFRQALYFRLRDHQIRNNSYMRSRDDSKLTELKPLGKQARPSTGNSVKPFEVKADGAK